MIDKERSKREQSTDNTNQGLRRVQKGIAQIHFTSYTSVFNVIMGAERRNHRLVVKLGFEKLLSEVYTMQRAEEETFVNGHGKNRE